MNQEMLGNMVRFEREKHNLSAKKLADGICSAAAVQRLESGSRVPDFFTLERIIERLGRSVNKLELLQDETAYELYYRREILEKHIEDGEYEQVEAAIEEYKALDAAKEALHRQYLYKMQAVLAESRDKDYVGAKELLENALKETLPELQVNEIGKSVLGESEIILLLMKLEIDQKIGEGVPVEAERKILSYIQTHVEDEEAKANIYSKAAWVFGKIEMERKNQQLALWYTLQGEKILTENGLLLHLPQFLERILQLTKETDVASYEEWKKQRDVLKNLYEEYGERYETESVALWKLYRQQEIYLVSELFEQERKIKKLSQEQLADKLEIDQKTVSRIETGVTKPKPGTFQKLKEYLEIDRDICNTKIVTDDFEVLEMERELTRYFHYRDYENAERVYAALKKRLDMKEKVNQQYVKYRDTYLRAKRGELNIEECIERYMEALYITREDGLENLDKVILSRMEVTIINTMVTAYKKVGKLQDGIELMEKVRKGYEKSKVDKKFHYTEVMAVYITLSVLYEENGQFDEAIKNCDEGIKYELQCKKGLEIGFLKEEKIYTLSKMIGNVNPIEYKQPLELYKLMRKYARLKSLKRGYEILYGRELN